MDIQTAETADNVQIEAISPTVDRDAVMRLLETEIAQINADQQTSGWTAWALLGALAAIIWTALDLIEPATLSLVDLSRVLIVLVLLQELTISIFYPPKPKQDSRTRSPSATRFFLSGQFHVHAHVMNWEIFRCALLLSLTLYGSGDVWIPGVAAGLILFGFGTLNALMARIMVIFNLVIPDSHRTVDRGILVVQLIQITLQLLVIIGFTIALTPVSDTITGTLRVGLLCAASLWLSGLLIQRAGPPPLLTQLIEIRRELGFGKIMPPEAASRAELAIRGLGLNDVVQRELQPLLMWQQSLDSLTHLLQQALSDVQRDVDLVRQSPAAEESAERHILLENLRAQMAALDTLRKQTITLLQRLNRATTRVGKRVGMLSVAAPDSAAVLQEILKQTLQPMMDSHQLVNQVATELAAMRDVVAAIEKSARTEMAQVTRPPVT